jgi:four helix bundle protein
MKGVERVHPSSFILHPFPFPIVLSRCPAAWGRLAGMGKVTEAPRAQTDLSTRTRAFALRVIRLHAALPRTAEAQVVGRQLLRSGTSVGAHYREASRARSTAEFISKIEVALQELEETRYWLELLGDAALIAPARLADLLSETDALTAILVTIVKKAKQRMKAEG